MQEEILHGVIRQGGVIPAEEVLPHGVATPIVASTIQVALVEAEAVAVSAVVALVEVAIPVVVVAAVVTNNFKKSL